MDSTRARLREQLTQRLVPVLLERGFTGPPRIAGNGLLHEYRRAGADGIQVLAIQLEKRQLPRFILNLHVEPPEGLDATISGGGTIATGVLKPRKCPYTRCWFRADPPWWRRLLNRAAPTREAEAVEDCIRLLPEVEGWWSTRSPSRHISSWTTTFPGTGGRA